MGKSEYSIAQIKRGIFQKLCKFPELMKCKYSSYNNFIQVQLPELIESFNNYELFRDIYETGQTVYELSMGKIRWASRHDNCKNNKVDYCHATGQTLAMELQIELGINVFNNDKLTKGQKNYVKICNFPVMVGSRLLNGLLGSHDLFGGYFIIDGAQRVVLNLEEISPLAQYTITDTATKKISAVVYTYKNGYKYMNKLNLKSKVITYSFHPIRTELDALALLTILGITQRQILESVAMGNAVIALKLLKYIEKCQYLTREKAYALLISTLYGSNDEKLINKFKTLLDNCTYDRCRYA